MYVCVLPISARFLRHVPVIYVDYPGAPSLKQIYGTFNRAMLRLVPNLRAYSDPLTDAMVDFYSMSQVRENVCRLSVVRVVSRSIGRSVDQSVDWSACLSDCLSIFIISYVHINFVDSSHTHVRWLSMCLLDSLGTVHTRDAASLHLQPQRNDSVGEGHLRGSQTTRDAGHRGAGPSVGTRGPTAIPRQAHL